MGGSALATVRLAVWVVIVAVSSSIVFDGFSSSSESESDEALAAAGAAATGEANWVPKA